MAKKKYKNIFKAIEANDIEAVKSFLPDQLNMKDEYGETPLHRVCYFRHLEIARLLLDSGADIEARDSNKCTPLVHICIGGNVELIRLFLDHGADIESRDKDGWMPIHYACAYEELNASEFLVMRGADPFIKTDEGYDAIECDEKIMTDELGNKIPHSQVLIELREKYLTNKRALDAADTTAALSSDWEMEI